MAPSILDHAAQYDLNDCNHETKLVTTIPILNGPSLGKDLVAAALRRHVDAIDHDACEPGEEDTFFVADLGDVYRQQMRWKRNLGGIKPHYAVKCNPDPQVLRLLDAMGTGFDCASKAEIDLVLNLGVDPSRIIYAQPCKTASYIRYAAEKGVKQMTFDNADELYKIKRHFSGAELFLRILTDDSASLCRLSLKFGAGLDTTQSLLELAKQLELNVTGIAFHVGSGASDPKAFEAAIIDARHVFDQAAAVGYDLSTLDVGGGFVSDTFEAMAGVISRSVEAHFPPHIRVIAEPGRFYVAGAFTIACHVIARRTVEDPVTGERSYMLYLNDGVYGNFSSIMFDHQHPEAKILRCAAEASSGNSGNGVNGIPAKPVTYSIWGPTCDGIDCITPSITFPASSVIGIGDWLFFEDMGAYTKCSATRFNGFTDSHDVEYVSSERAVGPLLGW